MNVLKLQKYLFYLYLFVFPLGQLLRIDMFPDGNRVTFLVVDILVILIGAFHFCSNPRRVPKLFTPFITVFIFSYVFSYSYFSVNETIVGGLYLSRVIAYVGLYFALRSLFQSLQIKPETILNWLGNIGLVIAVLGLIQYVLLPDLRSFVSMGWDAHLFRLAGTFFDPGFAGILLVLAFIVLFYLYSKSKAKELLVYIGIVLVALLLTYSRASYLAFGASVLSLLLYVPRKAKSVLILLLVLFMFSLPLLPRPEGVGVRLERTHSIVERVDNYNETIDLFTISPLWGIGYNNLCVARVQFDIPEYGEHSCSGADSSLMFILVTTGIVGIVTVVYAFTKYFRSFWNNPVMVASLIAALTHSLFQNSLFYPWVVGWFAILIAVNWSIVPREPSK